MEKNCGYEIRYSKTDKGDGFTFKEFHDFCESNGILHLLMVLKSPQ